MPLNQVVQDCLDMYGETVIAQPGYLSGFGSDWVSSGSPLTIPCYIEGGSRIVRDETGREVVSTVQVYLAGIFNLAGHIEEYRFTVPSQWSPNADLRAVVINIASDEDGPAYEEVMLP